MTNPNVSLNPEKAFPYGYSFSPDQPLNLSNLAPVSDEDEYARTTHGLTPSETYSPEEWEALCAHRRGNGVGGIE